MAITTTQTMWMLARLDHDSVGLETPAYPTEERAVSELKAAYQPPYLVTWSEDRDAEGVLVVTGVFQRVLHYATAHTAKWAVVAVPIAS